MISRRDMVPTPHDTDRHTAPVRVLQFVADTDPDPVVDAALGLHRRLVEHGLEVRTLALAPGNRPGHEALLPVVAPSRRSLAARSGVQVERRWADVVVLHGPRVLVHATLPPRSSDVPTVYVSPAADVANLGRGGRTAERFTRRLAAVVTTADTVDGSASALFAASTTTPALAPPLDRTSGSGASDEPAGEPSPDLLLIPIDAAAGAEWAALLRQLVSGCAPRRGG